jgi:dsRNA-specific ribonuclease
MGKTFGEGTGNRKRDAKMDAAKSALNKMEEAERNGDPL